MKEQLKENIVSLAKNFKENPEAIADTLIFASKFYHYSSRNTMLIYMQNPGATFVESFMDLKKKGFNVKKGEHGMKILSPAPVTYLIVDGEYVKLSEATSAQKAAQKAGKIKSVNKMHFKVGTVFDIGQTDCPVEKYPKIYNMGKESISHKEMFDTVANYAEKDLHSLVVFETIPSISKRGFYTPTTNTIHISDKLKDTERLSTLLHELSHAVLHNDAKTIKERSTSVIEFEADSMSIMLQSRLDIPITVSRKRHLCAQYNSIISDTKSEKEINNISEIIDNVFGKYRKIADDLETEVKKKNQADDNFNGDCTKQTPAARCELTKEPEPLKPFFDLESNKSLYKELSDTDIEKLKEAGQSFEVKSLIEGKKLIKYATSDKEKIEKILADKTIKL